MSSELQKTACGSGSGSTSQNEDSLLSPDQCLDETKLNRVLLLLTILIYCLWVFLV